MINKKIYIFLFIALVSFVSLSMFPSASYVETASKNSIECIEKKNNIESEVKEFSYLLFDSNFTVYEANSEIKYKDEIYSLEITDNLLRPPIYS